MLYIPARLQVFIASRSKTLQLKLGLPQILHVTVVAVIRDMAMPAPIEASACHWVASLPDLQSMIGSLESVEMLAVDVEHHHLHSYLGFVCLLQLSTGKLVWPIGAYHLPSNNLPTSFLLTSVLHTLCIFSVLCNPQARSRRCSDATCWCWLACSLGSQLSLRVVLQVPYNIVSTCHNLIINNIWGGGQGEVEGRAMRASLLLGSDTAVFSSALHDLDSCSLCLIQSLETCAAESIFHWLAVTCGDEMNSSLHQYKGLGRLYVYTCKVLQGSSLVLDCDVPGLHCAMHFLLWASTHDGT